MQGVLNGLRYVGILGSHQVYPMKQKDYDEVIDRPETVNLTPKKISVMVGAYCEALSKGFTPGFKS